MTTVYDDLSSDREFISRARVISSADVASFAELTGDRSAIHLDERAAAAGPFGRRIAHGMLVLSCSIGLAAEMDVWSGALIAFAGLDKVRFTAPVFLDDEITVRKRVIEKRPIDAARGLVAFDTRVMNQRGEIVAAYVDRYLLRRV
jgi:acyl dehydratase